MIRKRVGIHREVNGSGYGSDKAGPDGRQSCVTLLYCEGRSRLRRFPTRLLPVCFAYRRIMDGCQ